jgi:hypothetical protein
MAFYLQCPNHSIQLVYTWLMIFAYFSPFNADSISWNFSAPGCSGALVDWGTTACWTTLPTSVDDVVIDPPLDTFPIFSLVVNIAVNIKSISIARPMTFALNQGFHVLGSCQFCGMVNSTSSAASLNCTTMLSCAAGAAIYSESHDSNFTIRAVSVRNIFFVADSRGRMILGSSAACYNCTVYVGRGGEFYATSSIVSQSENSCTIRNYGKLFLGDLYSALNASVRLVLDCSVVSTSHIHIISSVELSRSVQVTGQISIRPGTTLTFSKSVVMPSLHISQSGSGREAVLRFLVPAAAQLSIHAFVAPGVRLSFETCPSSPSFLNISTQSDLDWNCPSSFFSRSNPSFLTGLASSRFQIGGSSSSVEINATVPPDTAVAWLRDEADDDRKAYWSMLFNIQIAAVATVASNILLQYGARLLLPLH